MSLSQKTIEQLDAVRQGLDEAGLVDFAFVQNELEIAEPRVRAVPHIWKWNDTKPWLDKTYAGMSLTEVHRRTLAFANPGLSPRPFVATTLFTSISIYYPNDEPAVHRHTGSASRFLLEGDGAFTTVAGEKCTMERGDLVITPNGQWHDHGNDGDAPVIWMNVLDVPFVENLNAIFTEWDYSEIDPDGSGERVGRRTQSVTAPEDFSQKLFGAGGIVPRIGPETRGGGLHSPMFAYRWEKARHALSTLGDERGDPFDGIVIEYVDPMSGQSVVPTISFRSQMLRPGEQTRVHRHTSSTVHCVFEGHGYTEVEERRIDWNRNDLFVIPGWMWHRHVNLDPSEPAFIYSVTDAPIHRKLGFYREQERTDAGEIVDVVPWPPSVSPARD